MGFNNPERCGAEPPFSNVGDGDTQLLRLLALESLLIQIKRGLAQTEQHAPVPHLQRSLGIIRTIRHEKESSTEEVQQHHMLTSKNVVHLRSTERGRRGIEGNGSFSFSAGSIWSSSNLSGIWWYRGAFKSYSERLFLLPSLQWQWQLQRALHLDRVRLLLLAPGDTR